MIQPFWRLGEAGPANLGLAFTDDGLLLGHTSLIERRGGPSAITHSEITRPFGDRAHEHR
jgi:hypothetical protein